MFKNNRTERRYAIFARVVVTKKNEIDPVTISAQVNSISEVGLGLYSSEPIDRFTEISMNIEFFNIEGKKENDTIDGKVVWLSKQNDIYYMGIYFDKELNADKQPNLYRHFHRIIKDD